MSQQIRVTRKIDCRGAVKVGMGDPITKGKVLFVDTRSWGVGAAGRDGLDYNYPLNTVTNALSECTAGNGDYIFVLDGYDNDAVTIEIAKSNVHIIGLTNANHRAPWPWLLVNSGAAAVFTIKGGDAANVEIAGLTMGGNASNPCITTSAGTSTNLVYGHIHHCAFAASGDAAFVAQDGILIASGTGLDNTLVEDCTFGDEITRDGIRFPNFYGGLIRHNLFDNCGAVCVNSPTGGLTNGMPDVIENFFRANHGASEGWAITCGVCTNGLIAHNIATSDFDTSGANPYLDTGDNNQWAMNYQWNEVMAPATT